MYIYIADNMKLVHWP